MHSENVGSETADIDGSVESVCIDHYPPKRDTTIEAVLPQMGDLGGVWDIPIPVGRVHCEDVPIPGR